MDYGGCMVTCIQRLYDSTKTQVQSDQQVLRKINKNLYILQKYKIIYLKLLLLKIHYFNKKFNLRNFKSFCGRRDAFDCAEIRARVFRLPADCSNFSLFK